MIVLSVFKPARTGQSSYIIGWGSNIEAALLKASKLNHSVTELKMYDENKVFSSWKGVINGNEESLTAYIYGDSVEKVLDDQMSWGYVKSRIQSGRPVISINLDAYNREDFDGDNLNNIRIIDTGSELIRVSR